MFLDKLSRQVKLCKVFFTYMHCICRHADKHTSSNLSIWIIYPLFVFLPFFFFFCMDKNINFGDFLKWECWVEVRFLKLHDDNLCQAFAHLYSFWWPWLISGSQESFFENELWKLYFSVLNVKWQCFCFAVLSRCLLCKIVMFILGMQCYCFWCWSRPSGFFFVFF